MNRSLLLPVSVFALLGAATILLLLRGGGEPDPVDSWFISPPYPAPELELPTARGSVASLARHRGQVVVLFFGFTHCPDICPLTLANLARVREALGPRGSALQVFMVTVDPERDTPERLAEYMDNFHPDFVGLRGEGEQLEKVLSDWGIYAGITPFESGEGYSVDHTARAFVVGPHGGVELTIPPFADAEEVARALFRVLGRAS